jgi:RES domain-containing protein
MSALGPVISTIIAASPSQVSSNSNRGSLALESKESHAAAHQEKNKAIVHHYKVTATRTYQVDDTTEVNDELEGSANHAFNKTKSRKSWCDCFGKAGK